MRQFLIFQALWSMERRHTDGAERSLEENVAMIRAAGFDGVGADISNPDHARRLGNLLKAEGLQAEGQCFPRTVEDLKSALDNAATAGVHHVTIQADVRPRAVQDCLELMEGWLRLAEDAPFPVLFETHRNRITNDLYFTLDLLDRFPAMLLTADLSHYVVGRECEWPMTEENHALMRRLLDRAGAFHGRVASAEQVQIELSFPHHRPWVELFLGWWDYGFRGWRQRAAPAETLAFVCELGPKPYAITGPDGNDTTDRWRESLMLKEMAASLWATIEAASS